MSAYLRMNGDIHLSSFRKPKYLISTITFRDVTAEQQRLFAVYEGRN